MNLGKSDLGEFVEWQLVEHGAGDFCKVDIGERDVRQFRHSGQRTERC
jgi:hypothetical protein